MTYMQHKIWCYFTSVRAVEVFAVKWKLEISAEVSIMY